ncbi:MAG TPA: hypothetical protein VNN73_09380 [Blastocatellia bacterium]|nr:hypothetical protein [Blastocatellia bacterium]
MWKDAELEKKERLLDKELDLLAAEVSKMKIDHRADVDALRIEIEAIKLFLFEFHPEFSDQFPLLKERARQEISPE